MSESASSRPSPHEVVGAFFAALTSGDREAAIAHCSPEAVWSIPGDANLLPWAGEHQGRAAVAAFYELLDAEAEAEFLRLGPIAGAGDQAYVRGEFGYTFPRSGGRYRGAFVVVFTVRSGRIVRYEMHEDSLGLARAYAGSV